MENKPVLFDEDKLLPFFKDNKIQPFRAKQLFFELYKNQTINLDDMVTLPKDVRETLKEKFAILSLKNIKILEDGETTKFGFITHDGHMIEAVAIYHYAKKWSKILWTSSSSKKKLNRITLCISSQVGCAVGCIFCVTGKLWFTRNLTWDEMVSQILFVNNYIRKKFGKKEDGTLHAVRNVVFMWMGEPLLNYDNVKKSIDIMLQQDRLSLSRRHVTISTSGILPGIQRMIDDEMEVKLAVSLHAPNQELREKLVPVAKWYQLKELMELLHKYVQVSDNRIFYEYIMIKDLTDTEDLARELAELLRGQLCHVNLIPYNENPAIQLQESNRENIKRFKWILEKKGITVTLRDSMGREAKSACGQLWYESVKGKKEEE